MSRALSRARRAGAIGRTAMVHLTLGGYCLLVLCPILLVLLNSFKTRAGIFDDPLGLVNILTFVGNFNAFDLIYAVKGALAGPNFATDLLGTLFYRTFFGYQSEMGSATMGAALATLMFLVILGGVGLYFFVIQRRLQRVAG